MTAPSKPPGAEAPEPGPDDESGSAEAVAMPMLKAWGLPGPGPALERYLDALPDSKRLGVVKPLLDVVGIRPISEASATAAATIALGVVLPDLDKLEAVRQGAARGGKAGGTAMRAEHGADHAKLIAMARQYLGKMPRPEVVKMLARRLDIRPDTVRKHLRRAGL